MDRSSGGKKKNAGPGCVQSWKHKPRFSLVMWVTKPEAEASRPLKRVAFDLILCSVDKVVTIVLEWDPCSSICRTVWGGQRTGQRLNTNFLSPTTASRLSLFFTTGSLHLCFFKIFSQSVPWNNYKSYLDFKLNLSTEEHSSHCWRHDSR